MKAIIEVKVSGAEQAPDLIGVLIKNFDNKHIIKYESQTSFKKSFEIYEGKNSIVITGLNAIEGYTEISIKGKFKGGPLPYDSVKVETPFYSKGFYVEV